MKGFATYKRFSAEGSVGLRLQFEYQNGDEWEELFSEDGKISGSLEFDVRQHVKWHRMARHRLTIQLMVDDRDEFSEMLDEYGGELSATVSARSGLIHTAKSTLFNTERCRLTLELQEGSLADKLRFSCSISAAASAQALTLWESQTYSVSMLGKLAKFPVEVRHFEDEWKWLELRFVEQELADVDLDMAINEAFILMIDDRKPGWHQVRSCLRSEDRTVRAAGISQLRSLVILSISEWVWRSAESDQANSILNGQWNGEFFPEGTLGYMLHLLFTSKLDGERLLNNTLGFAFVAQMANAADLG